MRRSVFVDQCSSISVRRSVFVVVISVGSVAAAVMDIVHVVTVGHRDMTAAGAMVVIMTIMN